MASAGDIPVDPLLCEWTPMRYVLLPLLLILMPTAFLALPLHKPSALVRTSEDAADDLDVIANALANGEDPGDIIARIRYVAAVLRANDDPIE